jgi:YVTN family beta-propeller protein
MKEAEAREGKSKAPNVLYVLVLLLLLPTYGQGQTVIATVPVATNPTAVAVNAVTDKIYVASCTDRSSRSTGINGSVTVIDGNTNATASVEVGMCPVAIAVNETTNQIYVSDFGHTSLYCGSCFNYGDVTIIDGETNSTTKIVDDSVRFPQGVAVNPATNKVYVANDFNASGGGVDVIDGNYFTTTVAVGNWPYAVAVNSTTNKVYVTSYNPYAGATSTTVSVIDGTTNISTPVTDPKAAESIAVAVNPVTNKIYVANVGDTGHNGTNIGSITVIDGATNSTTDLVDPMALGPHAVEVNPVTNKIYVANLGSKAISGNGGITIIDGATESITAITDPNAMTACSTISNATVAVDPSRNLVYVANHCSNNISVIDGATNSVVTVTDPNATGPTAVGVNSVTNKIYVANAGSNNVTVIDGGVGTEFTLSVVETGSGSGHVTSNAAGIDCGSTCVASFVGGTPVSLSAAPNSGSTFSGWDGACTGTDPNACVVALDSNQSVTATFTLTIPPDFSLSPASASLTIKRGGQGNDVLTFNVQGGFSGTIALTCSVSGPAPTPTCAISPNSTTPGNKATLTVNASMLTAELPPPLSFERAGGLFATWLPLGLVGCILATGIGRKRCRKWLMCLVVMVATILPVACGTGTSSSPPPPPQDYSVTVTATSGALQHSTTISVTMQ